MKRPAGVTLLALLLGWLGIAGVANGIAIFSGGFGGMHWLLGLLAFLYAGTAFLACLGLWNMHRSALAALHSWMLVCVVFIVAHSFFFEHFLAGGWLGVLGFFVFIAMLFGLLHRYVSAQLKDVA